MVRIIFLVIAYNVVSPLNGISSQILYSAPVAFGSLLHPKISYRSRLILGAAILLDSCHADVESNDKFLKQRTEPALPRAELLPTVK